MTTMLPTVAVFIIMMTSFTQGGVMPRQQCVGKIPHPTNCFKFIDCGTDSTTGNPDNTEMNCAFFTTFDESLQICNHNDQTPCANDPCSTRPNNAKTEAPGNCRGYYECSNGISNLKCCDQFHLFDSVTQMCVFNDTCTTGCHDQPAPEPNVVCDKVGNTGDLGFQQSDRYIDCGKGSAYIAEDCSCNGTIQTPSKPDLCEAEVFLTFNDGIISDKSGKNTPVVVTNVKVSEGKAIFTGNGKIDIPRFSDVGAKFMYIAVNYTSTGTGREERVIVSDKCPGQTDYSIMVTENTAAKVVNFEANTANTINTRFSVSDGATGRLKTVVFRLENDILRGMVHQEVPLFSDSKTSSPSTTLGSLNQIPCGLQIGYASGRSGFVGTIDAVTIYHCNPSAK